MPYQVIYSSRATDPMGSSELEEILEDARKGNEARDVTGVLLYTDGVFLQILEGERNTVQSLLSSIRADERHGDMKVFYESEVPTRAFSDWRMAYLSPDLGEMARWAGLDATESIEQLLDHVHGDAGRVPSILVSILEAIAVQAKHP